MADSFGADRQAGDHQDARHTGGGTNGKRAPIGVGIDCHLLVGWCRGLLAKLLPLLDAPREQSRGDLEGWAGQARERGKRRQLEVRAERPAGAGGRGEWRALERESEQMREAGSGREGARMRSGRRTHAIGKAHTCDGCWWGSLLKTATGAAHLTHSQPDSASILPEALSEAAGDILSTTTWLNAARQLPSCSLRGVRSHQHVRRSETTSNQFCSSIS